MQPESASAFGTRKFSLAKSEMKVLCNAVNLFTIAEHVTHCLKNIIVSGQKPDVQKQLSIVLQSVYHDGFEQLLQNVGLVWHGGTSND